MKEEEQLSVKERRDLAKDENTPPEMLAELAEDEDWIVRSRVANNPSTPPEVLNKLALDKNTDVREWVANNPGTPPETLAMLTTDKSTDVRKWVAHNRSTSLETLTKLAKDKKREVREEVACNPNTPPETLTELGADRSYTVRIYVGMNRNTPPETLTELAEEPYHGNHYNTHIGLAKNPSTPFPALSRLMSDPQNAVAKAARQTIREKILFQISWSDGDKAIALGLFDETQGKSIGRHFPSLEAFEEAVETYKSISDTKTFDPNEGLAIEAALILAD